MKKIFVAAAMMLVGALSYYFVFRSFEFEVKFKAKTTPGDLIETLRIWDRSLDSAQVISVDSMDAVQQVISWNDRRYEYSWKFHTTSDSVTQVIAQISEPGRSFLNKLLVPFTQQQIEKDADKIVRTFYKVVHKHLEITNVKIIGETHLNDTFCVCRSLETSQTDKANGMMANFGILSAFIDQFHLKVNGVPIVHVTDWNHNAGTLKFDFCFPVKHLDSLPKTKDMDFKTLPGQKVLKAEFYGNYITSDRAWYALIDYATKNNYLVTGWPIEHFHNNPQLGIGEKEWKAEVFLPVE